MWTQNRDLALAHSCANAVLNYANSIVIRSQKSKGRGQTYALCLSTALVQTKGEIIVKRASFVLIPNGINANECD